MSDDKNTPNDEVFYCDCGVFQRQEYYDTCSACYSASQPPIYTEETYDRRHISIKNGEVLPSEKEIDEFTMESFETELEKVAKKYS